MLGKVKDLRKVRVEMTPLNAKVDFAATRTVLPFSASDPGAPAIAFARCSR